MQFEDLLSALPRGWRRDLGGFHVEPVKRGDSDAQLFRLFRLRGASPEALYLKASQPDGLTEFRHEIERTRWLSAKGVRVPNIIQVFDDGRLGAALMTALPGLHPDQSRQPAAQVVAHVAQALRSLHALAVADCPFDETVAARLTRAREMIEQGRVDCEEFADRNRERSAQAIYAQLVADAPRLAQDIVLVHGDAKFDNLLVDDAGSVGFIDCGRAGRGDRYLDLEAVASDIDEHFGAPWVENFARCYGVKLDAAKMRFFGDLYELF